jgi:transcriptional regulator with XRE-family HTH domain
MWESTHFLYLTNQLLALLLVLLYLAWRELRKARTARRWTAEEAAEHVGVDVRTYLGWERNERLPRPLNQLALQRAFPELNPADEPVEEIIRMLQLEHNEAAKMAVREQLRQTIRENEPLNIPFIPASLYVNLLRYTDKHDKQTQKQNRKQPLSKVRR